MEYDDRITKRYPRGQHIALMCRNHPALRWSTKNISPIGCRTIYFNLSCDPDMGDECDCKISDLIAVEQ